MLLKNTMIKIRKSFGRYLSMFTIVLVGVGFYAGIQATTPNMIKAANEYYQNHRMMDMKIVSTMGLTKQDENALASLDAVSDAVGSYSLDVLAGSKALRVHAIENTVNQIEIVTGRQPQNNRECIADDENYRIGDEIHISSDTKGQLKNDTFTVVGTGRTVLYLAKDYGSVSIGDGDLSSFFFIPKDNFSMDAFTEIYLSARNTQAVAYTDEYRSQEALLDKQILSIKGSQEDMRYKEIYRMASDKIKENQKKLDDNQTTGELKLAEAKTLLDDSLKKLNAGKLQLKNNEALLDSQAKKQQKELEKARKEITAGFKQIDAALRGYGIGREQVGPAAAHLMAQIKEMEQRQNQLPQDSPEHQELETAIADCQTQYNGLVQLQQSITTLSKSQEQLVRGEKIGDRKIAEAREAIKSAREEIKTNEAKINDGYEEWDKNYKMFTEEIADAQKKLDDASRKLEEIEHPKWHVFDRDASVGYTELKSGMDIITSVAAVLPLFFILIVVLITSNSMTRMIAEERGELGTLISLGYGRGKIVGAYLFYVLSTSVLGGLAGFFIGCSIIPPLIYSKFEFLLPAMDVQYDIKSIILLLLITILVMSSVTVFACLRELKHEPAYLMRPLPPSKGQRILLQRIGLIWNHLSFTWKVTMRNMFRYKKRALMTIVGVAGCAAFLVVGFGLRDSMNGVAEKQYDEVMQYSSQLILKDEVKNLGGSLSALLKKEGIEHPLLVKQTSYQYQYGQEARDALMIVPENVNGFSDYFRLVDANSQKPVSLKNDSVVITQKMADFLHIGKGETITLTDNNNDRFRLSVTDIVRNYTSNYVYLDNETYTSIFGQSPTYNTVISNHSGDRNTAQRLIKNDQVINVVSKASILDRAEANNSRLDSIIILIVVVSSLLALVVLYNLTAINISERTREIATLKVLGFYDKETNAYIYREAFLLTLISIVAGLVLGTVLHSFVVGLIEGDLIVFIKRINWQSYLWAILITLGFSLIMQGFTFFKLKRIDMIDSMKAVE